jgi:hypothetical protein
MIDRGSSSGLMGPSQKMDWARMGLLHQFCFCIKWNFCYSKENIGFAYSKKNGFFYYFQDLTCGSTTLVIAS